MNELETSPIHPTLLSRLARDEALSSEAIASSDLPSATSTVKTTSDRRLLHMTSKALSTVDNLMDCTDPKVRLAAASKALDISPATRPAALQHQEAAIPVAAFTALLEGLGSLFRAAPLRGAPDQETTVRSTPVPNPNQPIPPDASLRDATEVPFTKES